MHAPARTEQIQTISRRVAGWRARMQSIGRVLILAMSGIGATAAERPAGNASASTILAPEAGRLVVDVQGIPPPAPVFFTARVEQIVRLSPAEIVGEMQIRLRVVQGRPEVLTLGLEGDGDVIDVSGKNLRDWAVRQGAGADAGRRFLDLRPMLPPIAGASSRAPAAPLLQDLE